MTSPTHELPKWWARLTRRGASADVSPDVRVSQWKTAWMAGANARWAAHPARANPYTPGPERSAWDAGWDWASRNPDRRQNQTERAAHRRRRATDSTLAVKRAVGLGAVGVTLYAISRVLRRWARNAEPR
jgi:hypothetical protein